MSSNGETSVRSDGARPQVVIMGGGIAGLEALIGLAKLAPDLVDITLVSARPDFVYRPLLVEEPFGAGPAESHEIAPIADEAGARFVLGEVERIDPDAQRIELGDSRTLDYDFALVGIGGAPRAALNNAAAFPGPRPLAIDELLDCTEDGEIAFIVPPGCSWPLPLYELALMTDRHARSREPRPQITVLTPEPSPLAVFGSVPSEKVAELLAGREIGVRTGVAVADDPSGPGFLINPGGESYLPKAAVALTVIDGPDLQGLPSDENGFIPIDQHAQVKGAEHVYAAGDGTTFPVKQGGIATQQADAAIQHIAAAAGAELKPTPFRPVLRGTLLTGDASLNIDHGLSTGGGAGSASLDRLWWPPHKVGGRYLSPFLAQGSEHRSAPDVPSLDVEVSMPHEWHEEPMIDGLDPFMLGRTDTGSDEKE